MLHLSTERLATLVDESPTPAELAHLTSCAECSRERAMYRSLADLAASESTRIGAPLTRWESLRAVRNHSCSKHARSFGNCSRIS